MSKQDIIRVRTPTDLERKYNFAGMQKAIKNTELGINKTNKTLEDFTNATLKSFENIESQLDGNVATHFYSGVPSLENVPANEWITNEEKENHLSDLYYDKDTGKVYEFGFQDNTYCWIETDSNAVIEAMALANSAKDTADGKRRIFTVQPVPPYENGDLWFNEKEIFICQFSKVEGEVYEDGDFVTATKYTDDSETKRVAGDLEEFMKNVEVNYSTTTEMESAITKSEERITTSVNKTITEKVDVLQKQIDGAIETYTGSSEPTLENAPANEWSTDEVKDTHIGDLYIVNSEGGDLAGFYYRFEKKETGPTFTYQWVLLKDNEVTKALQDAKEANERAEEIEKNLEENYSNTVQMQSEIKQAADEINIEVKKKVATDEIISKINITPETIKILAQCIDVDGVLDVEKLNALAIKAGSVDAENITGQRISGKEFITLTRNKLDEDVVGLYIGSDGLDYCWDASNGFEQDIYGHIRVANDSFCIKVAGEQLLSVSGSTRIGGGNIGRHVAISTLLYNELCENDAL
ncbi:MAG: hypothetical protein IJA54_07935 [Tyzzerella sp.]|nr:hypothetical protein [Tyzzerella sp.]